MKAASYKAFGPARDVLVVGECEKPSPAPGEVLVRLATSGVNPSDVKKRMGSAIADIISALERDRLQHRINRSLPLDEIALSHEWVEQAGFRGCMVLQTA